MEASKFQFTNPYMEEVAFQGSGEKSAEKDVPLSNTIKVQVKKDEKSIRQVLGLSSKLTQERMASFLS